MANQNRQWALPQAPGARRSPKRKPNKPPVNQSSPIHHSGADSPSFSNARAMFENKSRASSKLPSPPKKRRSSPNVHTNVHTNPLQYAQTPPVSAAKPPPSMIGNEYRPNAAHSWHKDHNEVLHSTLPEIPPMDEHNNNNAPEPLSTIIEDNKNAAISSQVSPPPSMTANTYAHNPQRGHIPNVEAQSSPKQPYHPPNVAINQNRGYNANPNANRAYSPHGNQTYSPHGNQAFSPHGNQRGFNPPQQKQARGGYNNNRYSNNQYNQNNPNQYNKSNSFSPRNVNSVHNNNSNSFSPRNVNSVHNRVASAGFNANHMRSAHNRVNSGGYTMNNRAHPQHNRAASMQHKRVDNGSFNRNPSHSSHNNPNNSYAIRPPPQRAHNSPALTAHHQRNSTNNMGQNIQWNYGGNKEAVEPASTQIHHPPPAHPVNVANNDDEFWFYVDPFKMKVSQKPVNKYELKDMFIKQHINENCLIWNELYSDYVTIGDVPHLLNFFYDDTTAAERPPAYHHAPIKQRSITHKNANKAAQRLEIKKDDDDDPNNWKQCYTEDGKVYYKNLVNKEIVWTKPRALRGSVMKILLNDESIKNFKKASGSNINKAREGKKRVNKREQKEINEFNEKVGDVRWIPHSKDGYVIAQFVKRDGKYSIYQPFDDSELFESSSRQNMNASPKDKKKRKPIKIPTLKVKKSALSITNWDYMDKSVPDMVELPDLAAPYVLHNLKHRFLHQQIYTQVGEIMISINPYQLLPLYLPSVLEKYKYGRRMDKKALAPHIYDIARDCYMNIISRHRAQSIIISGESGSGKTECTKQILQFIAECAGNENRIEQKLLSTNPILESFGNCLTVRNNNSSRFGKYIEIYFNDNKANSFIKTNHNQIVKSFQTIYLLEKVRVCKKSKEERNYHIFYQLISCADMGLKKSLKLGKVSNYAYLQGIEHAPGINDAEDFVHLNKAFKDIGCFADDSHKNTVFNIYRICSGILWIGNILFESNKKSNDFKGDSCEISARSENAVRVVCHLFEIEDINLLSDALMYKSVVFNEKDEVTKMNLSVNKAYENRDALAKFLYNELFNWIVNKLNEYLIDQTLPQEAISNPGVILGVLDIFGFEILKKNSFEQLCINYTNERLQFLFDETVFRKEDALYEFEGIKVLKNEKFNNLPIIQLVDAKKTGIFSALDAQCSVPQSDVTTFMILLNQMHDKPQQPKVYEKFAKKAHNFIVHHYAGKVQYDARQFMNKNRDNLNMDLLKLLDKSQNELIRTVIGPTMKDMLNMLKQRKTRQTLSQSYKESLDLLIAKLSSNQNESHYIRCVKPNDTKQQNHWMGKLVLDQLTYSGVFEAIKIKKDGYPFRGYHHEFIERFIVILDDETKRSANQFIKQNKTRQCAEMIANYLLHSNAYQLKMGKTMVFYRQNAHQIMEQQRDLAFKGNVDIIERYYRMYRERFEFLKMKQVKPKLEEAIRCRNINLLNAAVADTIAISFPMRLIVEAKNLRALMDKERHCEQQLQYVMNNKKNVGHNGREYVQDLSRSIAECEAIGYYSEGVHAAKKRLEEFTSHNKIRQGLRRGITDFDIAVIKEYLEMAAFCGLDKSEDIMMEAHKTLKVVNVEHELILQLQATFEKGGYHEQNQFIDYSMAAKITVDDITDALTKVHKIGVKTVSGKATLRKSRHLMQLRIALKKALIARNDDDLWNIVVDVINKAILKDMPSMASNSEIEVANNLIYIYFRDSFSDKFASKLREGIDRMDYALIKTQIATLYGKNEFELNKKYNMLLQRGRDLVVQMESVNNYLLEGLRERNMNLLSIGLARADDIQYTDHDLFRRAQSFYSKYGSFDVRLNNAIYEFDIDAMKVLLQESENYENKKNDPKILQIRNLIYNTPFDKLLQLQLNAAVSARDPEKVCRITLKLKQIFFEKNGNKFEWRSYPRLLTPESWAKSGRLFSKKGKLKKTFYVWSDSPIHHSLTDLNAGQPSTHTENLAYLNRSAVQMFRSMLGIMGDRRWEQPVSMMQDILIKISDFIPLRNEFYAQIIKQLSKNPSRESRIKGWNLMTVVLDTLKPPKDIENYLEKWLRDNQPENMADDQEFYVRLLHQTIFLGSRTKIPTLNQINDTFVNKNVRTLKISNNNNNKHYKQEQQQQAPNPLYYPPPKQQQQAAPPALTSIHEGKLQKQRIALQWDRTIAQSNDVLADEHAYAPGTSSIIYYYCGYTMDDETRRGNNWHYAPHKAGLPNMNINGEYYPHQQQQQPGAAIPYSVTDPVREYMFDM